jgi:ankyrin repeat protein
MLVPMKNKKDFLETIRRRIINNLFNDSDLLELNAEGYINELFIDNKNITLLMYYVKTNNKDKVKQLLAAPYFVKTDIVSKEAGYNALALAVVQACSVPDYDQTIVDELLKVNPDIQLLQKNKEGIIPLHIALQYGNLPMVKKLLQHNAQEQIDITDEKGDKNTFVFAARSKNIEVMAWIISEHPFILKQISKDGFSALHVACAVGNLQLINFLLNHGAMNQLFARNAMGFTPLFEACFNKKTDIVQELLKYNTFEQLSVFDISGNNIFHIMCYRKLNDVLPIILKYAKENNLDLTLVLDKKNNIGLTPMQMAIRDGNLFFIERLLKYGVDVDKIDAEGRSALNSAIFLKQHDVIELLLKNGANPNVTIVARDRCYSSLWMALREPDIESARLLQAFGAKPTSMEIEFIVNQYGNKENIYKKIRRIFPELPEIKKEIKLEPKPAPSVEEKENNPESYLHAAPKAQSVRQYLQSEGFSVEQIKQMQTKAPITKSWELEKNKPVAQKPISFLGGALHSNDEKVIEIENAHGPSFYCYLDNETLSKQGFDVKDFNKSRLKLAPDSVKKLDKDQGEYWESIVLPHKNKPALMQYTHELKVGPKARVLLIQEGALFIGAKFLPEGLHNNAHKEALRESTQNNVLTLKCSM